MKLRCEVKYIYENVPSILRNVMANDYMRDRDKIVEIFNEHIDEVNSEWNLTGKPAAFGEFIEDMNPEYTQFVNERIQPYIDRANENFKLCNFKLDDHCDIVGYIPAIEGSKLSIRIRSII